MAGNLLHRGRILYPSSLGEIPGSSPARNIAVTIPHYSMLRGRLPMYRRRTTCRTNGDHISSFLPRP